MKALSFTQPYATLVAIGAKTIETRSWTTQYRGPLAIHAAKGFPNDAKELCFEEPFLSTLADAGIDRPGQLPLGAVLAIVQLIDCQRITTANRPGEPEASFGDYTPGRYAWVFRRNGRRLPVPIPVKGALGLWEWYAPADVLAMVSP